ncbi:MAG: ergothioneine biosynthesis protein EgtB [Candidatus Thiodiazotropha sp.]
MDATITPESGRDRLMEAFGQVRHRSDQLCDPLSIDDYQIQSVVQTSPPKWHMAHTSWFFETFVLARFEAGYQPYHSDFDFLFNSYYYTHGSMHPRARRGLLSRPTVDEVYRYREQVNARMRRVIEQVHEDDWETLALRTILGLNHEEQHQELLLMDIKHNFWCNPLKPAYRDDLVKASGTTPAMGWFRQSGGIHEMGHSGGGFAYDNETPRHAVLHRDFALADRFVTNEEYQAFIDDRGYERPELWLSDGWALLQSSDCRQPLYWQRIHGEWQQFSLSGLQPLNPHEPVCHVSYYEADAYARWSGRRLPLESELELVLSQQALEGHFADRQVFHPAPAEITGQWYGDLWAWTASPYSAYPGFKPLAGTMGEYNGKFMANQMVLKGGCCVTPAGHTRASYRNFFYPDERWAFTGIRLAEDI